MDDPQNIACFVVNIKPRMSIQQLIAHLSDYAIMCPTAEIESGEAITFISEAYRKLRSAEKEQPCTS